MRAGNSSSWNAMTRNDNSGFIGSFLINTAARQKSWLNSLLFRIFFFTEKYFVLSIWRLGQKDEFSFNDKNEKNQRENLFEVVYSGNSIDSCFQLAATVKVTNEWNGDMHTLALTHGRCVTVHLLLLQIHYFAAVRKVFVWRWQEGRQQGEESSLHALD